MPIMDNIFIECFSAIDDPRINRTKKHNLLDILALAISGILSGAQTWQEIEDFGNDNLSWFSRRLALPHGIPSHDTIERVFAAIDPASFQNSCLKWLQSIKNILPENIIAIDGKTLRGSKRANSCQKAFHILNAWSCVNQVCLGQLKVDGKSNEIKAIPELLELLYIKGAIITIDAMGAQEAIVNDICQQGADYVIALKGNQGQLHETVEDSFVLADKGGEALHVYQAKADVCGAHGRTDQRYIEVIDANQIKGQIESRWKNLNSVIRISYQREEGNRVLKEHRYYISSLIADNPEKLLQTIQSHWQVENCLHWSLDVTFREDDCRVRNENAAMNLSWLRKLSLGLLKKETSFKW